MSNDKPFIQPIISVIIPCYNEEATIQLLLDAIYRQTYPKTGIEVILSDGMSTDHTRDVINHYAQEHPDLMIKLVDNKKRNIPSALNRALDIATGKYIIRLDAHCMPYPDYFQNCVNGLDAGKGENVGGVWEIRPGGDSWIARTIAIAASHPMGVGDALYRYTKRSGAVDTVPFGSYKRSIFTQIGNFDETLLTNEDYEFNARLRKNGGQIWLDPSIRSVYFARATLQELIRQYWRYGYWKWLMIKRYPTTLRLRQALPPLFVTFLIIFFMTTPLSKIAANFLLLQISLYATILFFGTIPVALQHKDLSLLVGMPLAIASMHLSWGSGFLFSMTKSIFRPTRTSEARQSSQ